MSALLLDVSLILIYMIFAFTGFKSGIIKSFLTFINSIFSSFAALYFSKVFSNLTYNYYFKPLLSNYLINNLPECNFNTRDLLEKVPERVIKILLSSGITFSNITHIIGKVDKEFLHERIIEIFKPIFMEFTRSLLSSILFILFISLGHLIIRLILKFLKLGAIKNISKVIGSIFGILKGYIIISIFMCCLKAIIPYCGNKTYNLFTHDSISSTKIFKHMYINNPIYEIFEIMNNT